MGGVIGKEPACQWHGSIPQEIWVPFLGWEDPLEEGVETHSSILSWKIPLTEEPGRLHSTGSQRVRYNWSDLAFLHNFTYFLFFKLIFYLFFTFLEIVYWSIAAFQCWVSFCYKAKWISCIYTYIYSLLISFQFRSPQSTDKSSLCPTIGCH